MLWDLIRKRGQKQYEFIDKQIREEGQKWLDEMAAEEKKMQEESINSMKGSVLDFFRLGGGRKSGATSTSTSTGSSDASSGGEKKN